MKERIQLKNDGFEGFARTLIHFRFSQIVVILVLTLSCSLFDGVILAGIKLFIDIVSKNGTIIAGIPILDVPLPYHYWVGGMSVAVVLKLLVAYLKSVKMGNFFVTFEKHFQKKLLLVFSGMSNASLRREGRDECAFRFNSDFRVLEKGTEAVFLFIQALVQFVIFIPVLFVISWKLSSITLFCMLPLIAFAQSRLVGINKPIESLLAYRGTVHHRVSQYLSLIAQWTERKSLRLMQSELHGMVSEMAAKDQEVIHKKALIYGVSEFIANAGTVFVFALAGYFVLNEEIAAAEIITYLACLFLLYKPAKEFARALPLYKDGEVAWGHISELLTNQEEPCAIKPSETYEVRMKNLEFSYGDCKVFKTVTTQIKLNKPLLLSGNNGVGKSTLLKLIAGLERPLEGSISVPCDIEAIGYLDQDPKLPFIDFVAWGITAREKKERLLFEKLGVTKVLHDLKGKNIERLSELGMELSGGQRQRLALALMVTSDAQLLLLDEPTSYIPASDRVAVIQAVIEYCEERKKGLIVVTHDALLELENVQRVSWNELNLL